MHFDDILFEKAEGIATIQINRPEKLNAVRQKTAEEMTAALEKTASDPSIGVIVLKGAGGKAFCAGGDIEEMAEFDPISGRIFLNRFTDLILTIRRAPKPVIAAVKGVCLAGGNEINVACDLTVATEDSIFGQAGPRVGSVPLIGGTQLLPAILGEKRAREMVFLCQRYSAEEALQMGLINKVVPREALESAVKGWCEAILSMSPQAIRLAKVALNFQTDMLYGSYQQGIDSLSSIYGTPEYKEGMRAFLEKRRPDFSKFVK